MAREENKGWDTEKTVKVITLIVSIATVFIGIGQFNCNQKALKNLEYEKIFRNDSLKTEQRFIEKKIEVYSKIGEAVGAILANEKIDSSLKKSISSFEQIYYGEAIMVEDTSVNKAMKNFRFSAHDYVDGYISKEQFNQIGMALCDTLKKAVWVKKTVYQ